jgi:hypothetical protein
MSFDLRTLMIALLRDPEVAAAIRDAVGTTAADAWLSMAEAATIATCTPRMITDDEKRGRITLGRAGRRPVVLRSELDRWIASRTAKPTITKCANDSSDERSEARASNAIIAARMGRSK